MGMCCVKGCDLVAGRAGKRGPIRDLAGRFGALLKSEGIGDLYRLYAVCQRDGMDFNVAHIPNDFTLKSKEAFDPVYMNALFDVEYEAAKGGYPWIKTPFSLASRGAASEPASGPAK